MASPYPLSIYSFGIKNNGSTGTNSGNGTLVAITTPNTILYPSATGVTVSAPNTVNVNSVQYIYSTNPDGAKTGNNYVKLILNFTLLTSLLDTAPSGVTPNLFTVTVNIAGSTGGTGSVDSNPYIVNATIMTKGNTAKSPTYETLNDNLGRIGFPVTNFFNVSVPGAPYTLEIEFYKNIEASS